MRILGIDPGYALMGYGLVDRDSLGRFTVVWCGGDHIRRTFAGTVGEALYRYQTAYRDV